MICRKTKKPREGNPLPVRLCWVKAVGVDLFVGENEKKLLELLDLSPIAPDEVYLKPALLKTKPN